MKSFLNVFSDSFKQLKETRTLTTTGILLALAFTIKSLTIQVSPDLRIGFSFIPICVIAMLYGPIPCMMSTFLLDFIGYMVQNNAGRPYSPQLGFVVILGGLIYGTVLYKCDFKKSIGKSIFRVILSRTLVVVICNIILNTYFIFTLYVNKNFDIFNIDQGSFNSLIVYATPRVIKNFVQLPIDIFLMIIGLPIFQFAYNKIKSQIRAHKTKII